MSRVWLDTTAQWLDDPMLALPEELQSDGTYRACFFCGRVHWPDPCPSLLRYTKATGACYLCGELHAAGEACPSIRVTCDHAP